MRKYGISILLCWQVIFSIAQNHSVEFLPISAELSQNTVTDILQDKNGFIWIGTHNGLNKYDGARMVTYDFDEQDSTSLSSGYIQVIFEDSKQTLWVGTKGGGLCKYNEDSNSFDCFISKNLAAYLKFSNVLAICEDKDKVLWIGTENQGLISYNQETGKIAWYGKNAKGNYRIPSNEITSIIEDDELNLWVANSTEGLHLLDRETEKFINFRHIPKDSLSISSNKVSDLIKGTSGKVWIVTRQGLDWVDKNDDGKYIFHHQKIGEEKSNVIISVLEDKKANLWVGVENEGLYRIDLANHKTEWFTYSATEEFCLQSNSIWSLYEDNTGIIWVGTYNKGIYKADTGTEKFLKFAHDLNSKYTLNNNTVTSFAQDNTGNVWIGTDGGGLNYWNVSKNSFVKFTTESTAQPLKGNAVLSLLIDSKNNLWIGTWGNGVSLKRKGSNYFEPFLLNHSRNDVIGKENIYSIVEDRAGIIWFGSFGSGLYRYNPLNNQIKGYNDTEDSPTGISSNFITSLLQASDENLWVGTVKGLNKVSIANDKTRVKQYLQTEMGANLQGGNLIVNTIFEDSRRSLWVGTHKGLFVLDVQEEAFFKIGKKQGLPNENIKSIEEDSLHNLWISTNKGISKYSIATGAIENFTTADGLQAMEFFRGASLKLRNGTLLFGGVEGFNIFSPKGIKKNKFEPTVYLIDFKLSNHSVKPGPQSVLKKVIQSTKKITLPYNQNTFSFEFGMISFMQNSKNKFAYKLDGYDKDWQKIGSAREAFFTNIPPGNYTFRVKATNNDGVWSKHQVSLNIVIIPPWYATHLAYVIYAVLFIMLLALGYRTIINRERLKAALQVEHIELVKMQELDEMKSNFFANISHEFRTPLTLILGPLKSMFSSKKEKHIAMMIRNGESLLKLIDQLLELSKLESGGMPLEAEMDNVVEFLEPIVQSFLPLAIEKNITFIITMPPAKILLYFDKEKLEKVVTNLLSNAFKYTPESGKVTFKIKELEKKIVLSVEDEGIGIPENEKNLVFNRYYRVRDAKEKKRKGTGIGLSLSKELVELHKGRIELESVEGQGTVFRVFLKKGKQHLNPNDISEVSGEYTFQQQALFVAEKEGINKELNDMEEAQEYQILIIEDNDDIRNYICEVLGYSYNLLEADNGSDGIKMALEQIPDLIISDIMMPGTDGFEVCKKVKEDIKTSHIPVILLTAKAKNKSKLEGFEQGADYYITKPFDPELLRLRVRNALHTRNQFRAKVLNKKTLQIDAGQVKISSRDKAFISQVIEIVEKNMNNSNFSVDELGRELRLSRTQLYRKIKGLLGQSVNELVRSIRLKKAAQLLKNSQMSIAEITYEVGFNDLQYFRDCFKKQFGVTPSEFIDKNS